MLSLESLSQRRGMLRSYAHKITWSRLKGTVCASATGTVRVRSRRKFLDLLKFVHQRKDTCTFGQVCQS